MKEKVEVHVKTKYSLDYDSTNDIEAVLYNSHIDGERGVIIVDKDTIIAFPKIYKIWNRIRREDKDYFGDFKVRYGVQLTAIIEDTECEVILLVQRQNGLKKLYKIMSKYINTYQKKIPIEEIISLREGLLLGFMLNEDNKNIHFDLFDYIEINENIDVSDIQNNKKIVYSNVPNCYFDDYDQLNKEIIYLHKKIDKEIDSRLYLSTKDALEVCNEEEFVVKNPNEILDSLEDITICDDSLYITHDDYNLFEEKVLKVFDEKFKETKDKYREEIRIRIEEELKLIKEFDYTYYFNILLMIKDYCLENNEYFQLEGYVNNLYVSYVLGITKIKPYNLPYELFFSEKLVIALRISNEFLSKKLMFYIEEYFKDKLLRCCHGFQFSNFASYRIAKHYEIKSKKELTCDDKDRFAGYLCGLPIYRENINNSYYLIPDNMSIEDFTPYEVGNTLCRDEIKGTHFDYHDLENNFIHLQFIPNYDMETITNLQRKTKFIVDKFYDCNVYNLFRSTEAFKHKFKILDRDTGLLSFYDFNEKEMGSLLYTPNLFFDELVELYVKKYKLIIKDDLYKKLIERDLEEKEIFTVFNTLKEDKQTLVSRASIENIVRVSYMKMFYKLHYPKEYYEELLDSNFKDKLKDVSHYSFEDIKNRYYELTDSNKILNFFEEDELELLEILIEMYERDIPFRIENNSVIIGE